MLVVASLFFLLASLLPPVTAGAVPSAGTTDHTQIARNPFLEAGPCVPSGVSLPGVSGRAIGVGAAFVSALQVRNFVTSMADALVCGLQMKDETYGLDRLKHDVEAYPEVGRESMEKGAGASTAYSVESALSTKTVDPPAHARASPQAEQEPSASS